MTKYDKFVIAFLFVLAIILYAFFTLFVFDTSPETAVVFVNGEEYARYELRAVNKTEKVEISTEFGTNVMEITQKGVKITDADCPDKLDVKSGEINKAGQMIVCVPNRFSVRLVGGKSDVDRVTY